MVFTLKMNHRYWTARELAVKLFNSFCGLDFSGLFE